MLKLCWYKNANYRRWSENNISFEKIATYWQRKQVDLFGVTIGAQLIGTFLLEKISDICNKSNIGLYRDDGLSTFRNKSGTQLKKIKKKIERLFREYYL